MAMTEAKVMAAPADAAGLLERAIGYAAGNVDAVTPQLLSGPTPCADWDLRRLLHHVNDSLDTLREGIDAGRIGLHPAAGGTDGEDDPAADPVAAFRDRAARLLGAWSAAGPRGRMVAIAGHPLAASVVAGAGAIEVAVHGWDIARACGHLRPIPAALAIDLLRICPLVVTDGTRHRLFADPVAVSPLSSPGDWLVAYLGRSPE